LEIGARTAEKIGKDIGEERWKSKRMELDQHLFRGQSNSIHYCCIRRGGQERHPLRLVRLDTSLVPLALVWFLEIYSDYHEFCQLMLTLLKLLNPLAIHIPINVCIAK
jgi:hypothetical protein